VSDWQTYRTATRASLGLERMARTSRPQSRLSRVPTGHVAARVRQRWQSHADPQGELTVLLGDGYTAHWCPKRPLP